MEQYYIGLDIGTNSVGWAVTNTNYKVLKFKGNAMWGIRLLEESKGADKRRNFRSARRRTQRNRYRLDCLEMLFDKEIAKIDPAFFQRLKESNLYMEDKSYESKYSVFNDTDFTDKDYHKKYKTIYHLRKELIESDAPHDIRLVYLAISHIIKNRGHFLFDTDLGEKETSVNFNVVWDSLNLYLRDNYDIYFSCDNYKEIEDILKSSTLTKTKKKQELINLFDINKRSEPQKSAIISFLSGCSTSANDLFSTEIYKDSECKSISLSSNYDDNCSMYESTFGEEFELIERIKSVYDWAVLADILKGEKYISFAKVNDYEKHKSDLKLLKTFVKDFCFAKKNIIFNENKKGVCNYLAYSKHSKGSNAVSPLETACSQEKFCEFLRKTLPKDCPDPQYSKMYEEIAAASFMPKMVTKDNSVIPMQVNKIELKKILDNAVKYLPLLSETDESNKTVSERIMDIFSFRIPYYVGPLNTHSDKHWLVRTDGKIYPWNFEQVVDTDISAEAFINNLTSKCTYLPREDVIPKSSLLYSSFMVLNELNNLKIDSVKISTELKQDIYFELFMKKNKVTQKALMNYLKTKHGLTDFVLSGIDGDFKSNLKSYRDLAFLDISNAQKEDIIKAITIFGDDKKLLKRRLKNQFGTSLSDEDIKKICKLKYTDWSKLSKKFLMGLDGTIKSTGEVLTIIRALWETNNNLMQLLSDENTFTEKIKEENGNISFKGLRGEVEALYVSPKIKRPIYQSMQIVQEIVKIMKCAPAKIFVEVPRGDDEKARLQRDAENRTVSRKEKLLELYKMCKNQEPQLYELLQNTDANKFKRDALYLYFTQFGKCMYTGKSIDIEEIYNKNLYDVDHIFPQSKIKDDSLDNRVLVCKTVNENKGNIYPINESIRKNQSGFWYSLKEKGLISNTKYERLIRNTPLTDDELSAFIARQLVETRQSTKAIAQLLEKIYTQSEIVYVKASLASDFRKKYDFIKSRDVNDLHHAKDAYLNIVVGNVYNTQFNHNKLFYVKGLQKGTYSINQMFNYPVKNAWITENNESIGIVRNTMNKNNILYTRYSYKQRGGLFDQNILKKGNGQVSIKGNSPRADIQKYGGYNRAASTYFAVVEFNDKKGKKTRRLIPVDLYLEKKYLENPEKFMCNLLGVTEVKIIIPCVKYNTLISVNGFRLHISSKSGGGATYVCKPAVQLALGYPNEKYIKAISKYLERCALLKEKDDKSPTAFEKLTNVENIELYDTLTHKLLTTVFKNKFERLGNILNDKRDTFEKLPIYEQCYVLMQILTILHANVRTGDLTFIGEAKKSGVVSVGCEIKKSKTLQSFKIIHQSITGLFEKETELLNY